jgi:flagellar hook protein FlgE
MSSFISALGGLRANQSWIDVIGNNLANTNTNGFKASRALFADLLSVTYKSGTAPTPNLGGTNPLQVGLGVAFSHVDKNLAQGALSLTSRTFDLALLGNGYFAVNDGSDTYYTRVGAFGLDAEGNMVDQRTGYRVLDANGQAFAIDTSAIFPPQATGEASFVGNLPAEISGPMAEVLSSSAPFVEGSAATTTGSVSGPFTIPAGETWTLELVVNGGAPEEVAIVGTGSMSASDIAAQINAQTDHVVASAGPGGALVLTSDKSGLGSTIAVNPGESGLDLKELLGLADFVQGSESAAALGTDLNDLTTNLADYASGELISISGTDADGSAVGALFEYGVDGTTVGDFVDFLNAEFSGATAAFNATTGVIELTADAPGEAELSLAVLDGSGQTGAMDWAQHAFAVSTAGAGPDTVATSLEVFDSAGTSHVLTGSLVRQENGTWNLAFELPPEDGTLIQGSIDGISFNANGSLLTPPSGEISVQFNGLEPQTIQLNLGAAGSFDGLTQFGGAGSVVAETQNGYGAGELVNMSVDATGAIEGFYTNGQTRALGSFGVATFANDLGLLDSGNNYLKESPNSGNRILGAGQVGAAGDVIGGALEGSNVDTAEQFVHMIQAQRGFQANARVVTVQDQLLSDILDVV